MRALHGVMVAASILVVATGCTYHRAYFSYEDQGGDIATRAGSWDGVRLGVVTASEGGAVWKDCTAVAEGSVWVLMEKTRAMGGNAIGDFRWVPRHEAHSSETPMCRQRWGWFLIWPALLSPAFQSAGVEAVAYRVEDPAAAPAGLYLIPGTEEERMLLAERIAKERMPSE